MNRQISYRLWAALILAVFACPAVLPAAADQASVSVVWARQYPDCSLWRGSIPPKGKPVLLYGHGVNLAYLVPSPDGRYVATNSSTPNNDIIGLFDTTHPGVRHVRRLRNDTEVLRQ